MSEMGQMAYLRHKAYHRHMLKCFWVDAAERAPTPVVDNINSSFDGAVSCEAH